MDLATSECIVIKQEAKGEKNEKYMQKLDLLLRDGYFYNGEWVRCGKYYVDVCMEFEHFLIRKKKYLRIRRRARRKKGIFRKIGSRWCRVYCLDELPRMRGFYEGKTPYLKGILENRGIDHIAGCWQEIREEAFSYDEYYTESCCCLYREAEDICYKDGEKSKYHVEEFVYEDELAEKNRNIKFKYLYVAQVDTVVKEIEETPTIRQFIKYIQNINPRFYIMRSDIALKEISMPDGQIINMNEENKEERNVT